MNKNKTVDYIKNIIGSVTGYEIHSISIDDKFDEDLGIDSIEQYEILFTILTDHGLIKEDFNAIDIKKLDSVHVVAEYIDTINK